MINVAEASTGDLVVAGYMGVLIAVNVIIALWGIGFLIWLPFQWRKDFPKKRTR